MLNNDGRRLSKSDFYSVFLITEKRKCKINSKITVRGMMVDSFLKLDKIGMYFSTYKINIFSLLKTWEK